MVGSSSTSRITGLLLVRVTAMTVRLVYDSVLCCQSNPAHLGDIGGSLHQRPIPNAYVLKNAALTEHQNRTQPARGCGRSFWQNHSPRVIFCCGWMRRSSFDAR